MAVDLGALHAQHALVALGVEQVGLRRRRRQVEAAAADVEFAAGDDDGARAVAEEHRGAAVGVVGDAASASAPHTSTTPARPDSTSAAAWSSA